MAKTIKKKIEEIVDVIIDKPVELPPQVKKSEKDLLIECYEFMKSRGITSISHIENLIANCR